MFELRSACNQFSAIKTAILRWRFSSIHYKAVVHCRMNKLTWGKLALHLHYIMLAPWKCTSVWFYLLHREDSTLSYGLCRPPQRFLDHAL